MISCIHAYRLNQTGKSSFREVYHDNENHDYDHETDLKTFHTVRVHSRDNHKHITTAKNGQKRPKTNKNEQKRTKTTKNNQKQPKMVKNGQKRPKREHENN